jgi:ATP-dependent RNA helicase DDX46/PRP5
MVIPSADVMIDMTPEAPGIAAAAAAEMCVAPSLRAQMASLTIPQRRDYRDRDREHRRRDRSSDRRRRDDYYDSRDDRYRDEREKARDRDRDRDRDTDRSRDIRDDRRRSRSRESLRTGRSKRESDREKEREGRRHDVRGDRGDRDRAKDVCTAGTGKVLWLNTDTDYKSPAPPPQTEEEKIRQRRERLEAWKKKKAEEEAKKNAASTAALLSVLEKQPAVVATVASNPVQDSAKAPAQQATTSASLPNSNIPRPKADQGLSVPSSAHLGTYALFLPRRQPLLTSLGPASGSTLPTNRQVSTFGLGAAKKSHDKGKRTLDFGDEESARKKLERLPSPIPGEVDITGPVQDDIDDDTEMQDATEEESAAAARAAAAHRGERSEVATATTAAATNSMNEEEADPLDAFMVDINNSVAKETTSNGSAADSQQLFGDDEVDIVAAEQDPDDILAMAAKLKKKKELPVIDHSKMNYEPFRKSFYVEPAELTELSEKEVDELRLELDGIKIRGQDVPKPVVKWSQYGLPAQSLNVIQSLGYEKPTSIQAQAIPAIMSGRNVIGVAKTGSGKTIAFLLPMFRHIKDQRLLDSQDGPISLIMTPTRELAVQIFKECKPFLKALNLRVSVLSGISFDFLPTSHRLSVRMEARLLRIKSPTSSVAPKSLCVPPGA